MRSTSNVIAGVCLIAAPTLQGLSTFFWRDGYQGVVAGALNVVAAVCWIVGLIAVFRSIENRVPRYVALALPLAVYGSIGGVTFGVQGMYEELLGVSHADAVQVLDQHLAAAYLAFWFPGPLFPLSVIVLGIVLTRIGRIPAAIGVLLCVGGAAFPLSRIPRLPAIAHVADLLLLVPFVYLGLRIATHALRPATEGTRPADEDSDRAL